MDMKQILILGLLLGPVWTCKKMCYDEDEVSKVADRKLKKRYQQPPEPSATAAAASPVVCPVALYQQQPPKSLHERSLSPWRYVHVTKEDHFPSTYTEAQCLCSGCILIQDRNRGVPIVVESHDYNSVPIKQSRVFLKRERCTGKDSEKYQLNQVNVEVAVGCTCARVQSSS